MQFPENAVEVPRPQRWDEPFDPEMSDSEVAWLLTRKPFSQLDNKAFPRSAPLAAILRNDCRLRRHRPGEVIVREGDYGNSAFLVLSGNVQALLTRLPPAQLGRSSPVKLTWRQALKQLWNQSLYPESRTPADVHSQLGPRIEQADRRTTVFLQDFDGVLSDRQDLSLGPNDLFGEIAAMYRSPHVATVVAQTEAVLLEIRWQGLRLIRRDGRFSQQLEHHYRQHWLKTHLRQTPAFRYLPEDALQRVADSVRMRSFGRNEWHNDFEKTRKLPPAEQIEAEPVVAAEGSHPIELVLVRAGFARVCHDYGSGHRTTAYLSKGRLFGLEEIVHNVYRPEGAPPIPLQNSLRAVGFVDTLHIPLEVVVEDLLPYIRCSELPRPLLSTRQQRTAVAPLPLPTTGRPEGEAELPTGLLEFIVQNRLNNGQQAMLIDLDRCTRCDDCVTACAKTHDGNPRFARVGPRYDRLQFAQACMHCLDPICMIGCPTGAIARDAATGTVRIHEPICVGCGTCANACPYQNIQMVEVRDQHGRFYRDQQTQLPILKATKCDMCQSQPSGPACVAACPHDALTRIDLSQVDALQDWLTQRGVPGQEAT